MADDAGADHERGRAQSVADFVGGMDEEESMSVRQLRFKVGDHVAYPRGVGTIERIGEWKEDGKLIGIVFRINGSYWSGWQLQRVKVSK
jgi:hypothetical protein